MTFGRPVALVTGAAGGRFVQADLGDDAIAPGLVDTPLTAGWDGPHRVWHSSRRCGAAPAEVAEVAAMLVRSVYITGEVIVSDGGLSLT